MDENIILMQKRLYKLVDAFISFYVVKFKKNCLYFISTCFIFFSIIGFPLTAQKKPLTVGNVFVGKQYVLLIGIDKYEFRETRNGNVEALKEFKKELLNNFFVDEVIELYDSNATRKAIVNALKTLKMQVDFNDSVLICFSGYGYSDDNDGYWLPYDAVRDEELQTGFFANKTFKGYIADLNSSHVLILTDSGFNKSLMLSEDTTKSSVHDELLSECYSKISRFILSENNLFSSNMIEVFNNNENKYIDAVELKNKLNVNSSILFGSILNTGFEDDSTFLFFKQVPEEVVIEEPPKAEPVIIIPPEVKYGNAIVRTESKGVLYIDGNEIYKVDDSSFTEITRISTGSHLFELRYSDKEIETKKIVIAEKKTVNVYFSFVSDVAVAEMTDYDFGFIPNETNVGIAIDEILPKEDVAYVDKDDTGSLMEDIEKEQQEQQEQQKDESDGVELLEIKKTNLNENLKFNLGVKAGLYFSGSSEFENSETSEKKSVVSETANFTGGLCFRWDRSIDIKKIGFLGIQTEIYLIDSRLISYEGQSVNIFFRRITIPFLIGYTTPNFGDFSFRLNIGAAFGATWVTFTNSTVFSPSFSFIGDIVAIYNLTNYYAFFGAIRFSKDINHVSLESNWSILPAGLELSIGTEVIPKNSNVKFKSIAEQEKETEFVNRKIRMFVGINGVVYFVQNSIPSASLLFRFEYAVRNGKYGYLGVQIETDYGLCVPVIVCYQSPYVAGFALRIYSGAAINGIWGYRNDLIMPVSTIFTDSNLSKQYLSWLVGSDVVYNCNEKLALTTGLRFFKTVKSFDELDTESAPAIQNTNLNVLSVSIGLEYRFR